MSSLVAPMYIVRAVVVAVSGYLVSKGVTEEAAIRVAEILVEVLVFALAFPSFAEIRKFLAARLGGKP